MVFDKVYNRLLNYYLVMENSINDVPRNIMGMNTTYDEFPVDAPYGFWVDRSGNWVVVGYQGHDNLGELIIRRADKYLKDKGLPPVDKGNNDYDSTYTILFKSGFMRVTTGQHNCYYELYDPRQKPTTPQQKFLNMCKDMYGEEVKTSN
jgi:hypothetical protein